MTPREPDRFEEKANAVYAAKDFENDPVGNIAAALRQAADEALERALAEVPRNQPDTRDRIRALASPTAAPAACTCKRIHTWIENYGNCPQHPAPSRFPDHNGRNGPVWRDAAPAAEPCCAGASSGGLGHSLDCPRFPLAAPDKHEDWCALFGNPEAGKSCDCQPGAPSLLPRVLAALEGGAIDATAGGHTERAQERRALAAELRHYIAEMEAGHAEAPDAERDRNRHNAMLVEAWREEFNILCEVLFPGNDGPIGWKHIQAKAKALADGGEVT